MSQYTNSPCKGFTAGGAIGKFLRVVLSTGKLAVAGIANKDIGTTENAAFADGDNVTVRLRTAQGSHKVIAATDVAAGATVYTAAAGKVSKSKGSGAFAYGTALEAAATNGDVIEVERNSHGDTAGSAQ